MTARHSSARFVHRRPALAALAGAALFVSGCGEDGQADDGAKPSGTAASSSAPESSPPAADPQQAAKKEVLGAYGHFWDEQVKAYAKADSTGTELTRYATGNALSRAESDLTSLKRAGNVLTGKPAHDAQVTDLDLERKVPSATLNDCLDVSDWKTKNRKTGKTVPAPKGQLKKYAAAVKAEKWGKQWKILDVKPQNNTC
ncbi:hypothetical protein [Streptomyces sp. BRA346]|uniref:hypothetical protein n=1 Tax=Streptomyces sp. BRA346 TaxID=2878199 RepID=UPI004062B0AA